MMSQKRPWISRQTRFAVAELTGEIRDRDDKNAKFKLDREMKEQEAQGYVKRRKHGTARSARVEYRRTKKSRK